MEEKKPNTILRRERELRGWSQQTVAERIQTTEQVVCRWEGGQHKPNRYFQTQLCQLFGKSAEELGFMDTGLRSYQEEETGTDTRTAPCVPQESNESINDPSSFRIWLCGTFRMERRVGRSYETVPATEWGGSSYPRLLLKALLCCPGRQARRDALLDMLWPDVELEQAVQCLNTAVTRLRRVLVPSKGEASLLLTDEDSHVYRLAEQSLLWADVDAALTLLGEAERRGRTSPEALSLLEEAETYLSKGTILQEEEGQWAAGRRATVEQARYRTRLWLAEAYEQQQMPGQATTVLSHLLEEDPTDEDVLARLMLLLHRQDMTRQALRVYERSYEAAVREEVELTEATRKLAAQLAASERMYTSDILISPSVPLLSVSQQAIFPSFSHNMIPDLINRSEYPSQREYTIYSSSSSAIG